MKPYNSSIVRAQWSHWIGQNLLERQQDLMVETAHQIPMSPTKEKHAIHEILHLVSSHRGNTIQ